MSIEDKMKKIVVVDDHKMFLEGLVALLSQEKDFQIVFTANSGEKLKKFLEHGQHKGVDLAILDINMPGVDGIVLNHYIKKNYPEIKTLIVSMQTDPRQIFELTQNDVDGFVPKNASKSELLTAIHTILAGKKYFSKSIKELYTQSVFDTKHDPFLLLTEREKQVLKLIAQEYTTQEIADELFLSKYTIEGYRTSLISKLNVKNVVGLAKYAIKMGLVE